MPKISNVGWLNSNLTRTYPFKEGVSLSNGTVEIPKDFMVDAIFSGTNPSLRYRVNYIEVLVGNSVQVGFSDDSGTFLGVVNVSSPLPTKYISQFFQPATDISVRGRVVFSKGVETFAQNAVGRYMFGFSSAELEPSVLVPLEGTPNVVTSLSRFGDTENLLKGDVKLEEGNGVTITPNILTNALRIDLNKQFPGNCPEQVSQFTRCQDCIKFINGVAPRDDGNIDIVGTEFITVETDSGNNRIIVRFVGDVDCCCTACDRLQQLQAIINQMQMDIVNLGGTIQDAIP